MFDSIRETCYVYIWYYVIPLLEQYSVCYVQYSFMSFDILLLTFWHYCKICRFPKLTVWKEYSINLFTIRFFHNFVILLKWQCRLGKFQVVFFFINFTVWTISIFIITLRLYDLLSKLYHFTVHFFFGDNKIFNV